eukprot:SM000036S13317  [mRNA]  locus=s36:513907:514520:- [translate_table: standard]
MALGAAVLPQLLEHFIVILCTPENEYIWMPAKLSQNGSLAFSHPRMTMYLQTSRLHKGEKNLEIAQT